MTHERLTKFRGFTRLMVHLASVVALWPRALGEMWSENLSPGDVLFRIRQEAAIARGATLSDVHEMYRQHYEVK